MDELTEAAFRLLTAQGFDAVTVDEIAADAGVSKRTFFRYFASKEDVIVRFLAELGTGISAELAARPAAEPPSTALRHAVLVPLVACGEHGDRALRAVQLILRTPALHARLLERQAQWCEELAAELARRTGRDAGPGSDSGSGSGSSSGSGSGSGSDLYPRLAAGMALTAFGAVLERWSDSDGAADPVALTGQAFAVLAPALDAA